MDSWLLTSCQERNMMVMMMDLGWNLFPSTGSFGCLFLFNIVVQYRCWCILINDYHHHLREGGAFIKELHDLHDIS